MNKRKKVAAKLLATIVAITSVTNVYATNITSSDVVGSSPDWKPSTYDKAGDVDSDGIVTKKDAAIVLRQCGNIETLSADYDSKAADPNEDGSIDVLDAIWILRYKKTSIITPPDKSTYIEGEKFDPSGLTILLTKVNDVKETLTVEDITVVDGEPLTTDMTSVTVKAADLEIEVPVTVNTKSAVSLDVVTQPNKVDYIEGQDFDPTGLSVKITYNNGNTEILSVDDITIANGNNIAIDTKSVTISANGLTTDIPITVVEKTAVSAELTKMPDKVKYWSECVNEGETFDPTGMEITVVYDNGKSQVFTADDITVIDDEPLNTNGQVTVSVEVEGIIVEVPITVVEPEPINAQLVSTSPYKNVYIEGEYFDTTNLTVKISYNNGDYEIITPTVVNDVPLTLGTTSVPVQVRDAIINVPVTVIERKPVSAEIISNPSDTEYVEGETFDPTGIEIEVTYNDGSKETVTVENIEVIDNGKLAITDNSVTVKADGVEVEVPITVVEKAAVSAEVVVQPSKTEYVEGQTFDPEGLEVEVTNNDGSKEVITVPSDRIVVDTDTPLSLDDTTVKVIVDGVEIEVPITVVVKKPVSAEIISNPSDTEYVEGETFDPTGIEIEVTYNDGSKETVTVENIEVIDNGKLAITDNSVTVKADGVEVEVPITVVEKAAVSAEVVAQPSKTEYVEGQPFVPEGLEVEVTNNGGGKEVITVPSDRIVVDTDTPLTTDDTTVKVIVDGVEIEVPITVVAKKPVSAEIISNPSDTEYVEGETFDPTGIEIEVTYNDGSKETVTVENIEVIDNGKLAITDNSVTVKADGVEVEVPITVVEKAAVSAEVVAQPSKTEYVEGQPFNPEGLEVEVTNNDGSKEVITVPSDRIVVDTDTPLTTDDTTVKVIVDGVEIEIPITVVEKPTEATTEATTESTTTAVRPSSGGGHIRPTTKATTETTTEATTESSTESTTSNVEDSTEVTTNDTEESTETTIDGKFNDVIGHWSEEYIEYLHNLGIVNGIADELYMPNNSTKRGDFALVLSRMLELEGTDSNISFTDVPDDSYYAEAIKACAENDIYIGYGNGTFKPEKTITREEMMVIIAKIMNVELATDYSALDNYKDGSSVSWWSKPYVVPLLNENIIVGDNGNIKPQADITRAEMATVIYKYLTK